MTKLSRRKLIVGGAAGTVALGVGGLAARRAIRDQEPTPPPTTDARGKTVWTNWAGNEHSYPAQRLAPAAAEDLAAAMPNLPAPIRAVGSGHSFTALVPTDGAMVSLDRMAALVSHDAAAKTATVQGGMRLGALGPALAKIGQEMPNLPDINKQSLAGALATGTHGTGKGIRAMHGNVTALQLVTAKGEIVDCSRDKNADLFHAARVGLGAFGIVTQATLSNQPLKRVKKVSTVVETEDVLNTWEKLRSTHRNAEFLILPFTGKSALITHDETQEPIRPRGPDTDVEALMGLKDLRDWFEFMPGLRRRLGQKALADTPVEVAIDDGWKLLSNERPVRFKEMEYHLPIEAHVPALREVLAAIEAKCPDVFFPIEARIIAPDDAWLSPFFERESGSVAVHAYYKDQHAFLFEHVEPILRRYGGRPHWGKLHSLKAPDFAKLYPRWKDAVAIRRDIDPEGRMLNPHVKAVFGNG